MFKCIKVSYVPEIQSAIIDSLYYFMIDNVLVLEQVPFFTTGKFLESIEIFTHPYSLNLEYGYHFSTIWNPITRLSQLSQFPHSVVQASPPSNNTRYNVTLSFSFSFCLKFGSARTYFQKQTQSNQ